MRVLIVTGSSGGHIFPAIALLEALNSSAQEALLVLPQKSRQDKIAVAPGQIKYIPAANLSFNLNRKNIFALYFFLSGAWASLRIIVKFKPDLVVGFGSLNTIALIFWAWLFRIKTMVHEQNVICGRANKLLVKLVDKVAISFSQTRNYLNIAPFKIVLTGNPLRRGCFRVDKKKAEDFFKFKEGKFTILIMGGSQGSHRINAAWMEVLSACQKKDDLQLIHICGTQDFTWLAAEYAALPLTCKLYDFFYQMEYAYSVADLVICRAGATTIAEIQKFNLPALLIPYPFAYAHQLANAQVLADVGAAEVMFDAELSADKLKASLDAYFCNCEKLQRMKKAYQKLPVLDATERLMSEVLKLK